MASASMRLMVGRKHAGETFGEIFANDPQYCEWVLQEDRTGNLGEFAKFLQQPHDDLLCFGKHAGSRYSEALSVDPGYCDWAMSQANPSRQMAEFVRFVQHAEPSNQSKSAGSKFAAVWWDSDSGSGNDSDYSSAEPEKKRLRRTWKTHLKADADKAKSQASKAKVEAKLEQALEEARKAKAETKEAKEQLKRAAKGEAKPKANLDESQLEQALEEARQAKAEAKEAKEQLKRAAKGKPKPKTNQDESEECKVCMDAPVQTVFVPCGHMVACLVCSGSLKKKKCPICRKRIKQVIQTYKA